MRNFLTVAVLALFLMGCQMTQQQRQMMTTGAGGILGGLVGAQFGKGQGKTAMTGLGVAAGLVGGYQAGQPNRYVEPTRKVEPRSYWNNRPRVQVPPYNRFYDN